MLMCNKLSVVGVVVSFNPEEDLERHVRILLPQVRSVMIVDNASSTERQGILRRLERLPSVEIIRNSTNVGIAAALNQGGKWANDLQAEWLATFDQDSEPAADFVYQMLSAVSECASPERVGLIAPICVDANGFNKEADRSPDVQGHELTTAITSGNLVRLRALQESGGFRETFFIDYVDHELCFRLRRSGWRVIQASTAVLFHRLGKISEHHLFGKLVTTTNHSAGRRFTISRNRVWVYREYGLREFEWAVRDVASFLKEIVKIAMFEQQKIRKLLAVFRGVLSGLTSSPSKATRYLADATALTAKRPVAIANGRSNSQR